MFGVRGELYNKYIKNSNENQNDIIMKDIAHVFNKLDKNDYKFVRDATNNLYFDEFTDIGYDLNKILDNIEQK